MTKELQNKLKDLEKAWNSKDLTTWINIKDSLGFYNKELGRECPGYLKDTSLWNTRFTHDETRKQHYKDWNPYCCSDKPCKSNAWDRMLETPYGWECEYCKTKIGKHLFRIDVETYDEVKDKKLYYFNGGIVLTKPEEK